MKLWSFQPRDVGEALRRGERFICDPELSTHYASYEEFRRAYDWLIVEMGQKISRPEGVELPVWAWARNHGKIQRPDRRRMLFNRYAQSDVILELEVPDRLAILSDFDDWHCVLNGVPIRSDEEWEHDPDREFTEEEIRKSWKQVLTVENKEFVQACLWTIEPEWLIRVHSLRSR